MSSRHAAGPRPACPRGRRHDAAGDSRRADRGRRGQAVAEFAIVAPILLLLLTATAQFGTILATQIGITNAVREAAREASVLPTVDAATATANGDWTTARLTAGLLPSAPSFEATRLVFGAPDATGVCYTPSTDVRGEPEVLVSVRAVYRHALWLPLIGPILDGIDGAADDALRIGIDTRLGVENDVTPALDAPVCVP